MTQVRSNATARVLVVEDDPVTAEIASTYLAQSGLSVLRADTGEAALDTLRRQDVDWLVTDIKLPGTIDGWVVAAEFHLTHPTRPVLYMTAAAAPSNARAHGSVFLRKPCHPSLILDELRRLQAHHDQVRDDQARENLAREDPARESRP